MFNSFLWEKGCSFVFISDFWKIRWFLFFGCLEVWVKDDLYLFITLLLNSFNLFLDLFFDLFWLLLSSFKQLLLLISFFLVFIFLVSIEKFISNFFGLFPFVGILFLLLGSIILLVLCFIDLLLIFGEYKGVLLSLFSFIFSFELGKFLILFVLPFKVIL